MKGCTQHTEQGPAPVLPAARGTPGTPGSQVGTERVVGGREWAVGREQEWEGSNGQWGESRCGKGMGSN